MEGRKDPKLLHTFEHQEKTANFLNSNSGKLLDFLAVVFSLTLIVSIQI